MMLIDAIIRGCSRAVRLSIVLPMERAAHHFTVLVPVGLDDGVDVQLDRRNLAERITQIEKPAHASFDVKLYWGMFRVGEARVALDTLIGVGSRSVALVLDRDVSALGAAHLSYTEPWNATGRVVVGREGGDGAADAKCGCGCGGTCGCGSKGGHGTPHRTTSGTGGCGCQ